ncbi:hypothetical protein QQF64_005278 [Cirrhinus molitorella]|uniref:Uncharacterized protein n=1 Tax=Cirrhinus molitorella TaxID=172907 RepID=A0ABR3MEX0_9TELE
MVTLVHSSYDITFNITDFTHAHRQTCSNKQQRSGKNLTSPVLPVRVQLHGKCVRPHPHRGTRVLSRAEYLELRVRQ